MHLTQMLASNTGEGCSSSSWLSPPSAPPQGAQTPYIAQVAAGDQPTAPSGWGQQALGRQWYLERVGH